MIVLSYLWDWVPSHFSPFAQWFFGVFWGIVEVTGVRWIATLVTTWTQKVLPPLSGASVWPVTVLHPLLTVQWSDLNQEIKGHWVSSLTINIFPSHSEDPVHFQRHALSKFYTKEKETKESRWPFSRSFFRKSLSLHYLAFFPFLTYKQCHTNVILRVWDQGLPWPGSDTGPPSDCTGLTFITTS